TRDSGPLRAPVTNLVPQPAALQLAALAWCDDSRPALACDLIEKNVNRNKPTVPFREPRHQFHKARRQTAVAFIAEPEMRVHDAATRLFFEGVLILLAKHAKESGGLCSLRAGIPKIDVRALRVMVGHE